MHITNFPIEIIDRIIGFLEKDDLISLLMTCKWFYSLNCLTKKSGIEYKGFTFDANVSENKGFTFDTNDNECQGHALTINKDNMNDDFAYQLLDSFPLIQKLTLVWNKGNIQITQLGKLTNLISLNLTRNGNEERERSYLIAIKLKKLESLSMNGFYNTIDFKTTMTPNLKHLVVNTRFVLDIGIIEHVVDECRLIETIRLFCFVVNDKDIKKLRRLNKCHNLKSLIFDNLVNKCVTGFPLFGLTSLTSLALLPLINDFGNNSNLTKHVDHSSLRMLKKMTNLEELDARRYDNDFAKSLTVLKTITSVLTNLTYLCIGNSLFSSTSKECVNLTINLPKLKTLSIKVNKGNNFAFNGIENSTQLDVFSAKYVSNSTFLSLASLTNLRLLSCNINEKCDLNAISSLTNLRYLDISFNRKTIDIETINKLTKLEYLTVQDGSAKLFQNIKLPYLCYIHCILNDVNKAVDMIEDNTMVLRNDVTPDSAINNNSFQLEIPVQSKWINIIHESNTIDTLKKYMEGMIIRAFVIKYVYINKKLRMFADEYIENRFTDELSVFMRPLRYEKSSIQFDYMIRKLKDPCALKVIVIDKKITLTMRIFVTGNSIQWISLESGGSIRHIDGTFKRNKTVIESNGDLINTTKLNDNELTGMIISSDNHITMLKESGYKCVGKYTSLCLVCEGMYSERLKRSMWIRDDSVIQLKYPKDASLPDTFLSKQGYSIPIKATSMIPV